MTSADASRDAEWPDPEELLHRQVYPTWLVDDGEPRSQAFYPWRALRRQVRRRGRAPALPTLCRRLAATRGRSGLSSRL